MKLTSQKSDPIKKPESESHLKKFQTIFLNGSVFIPVLLLFLGFFWMLIFLENQFCVRDSANFYYPLFQQIQEEWTHGRLPLWDPYDNLGQPLAANPTSSVFYPGKVIFFLFPQNFDFAFKWYILLHYPLAFWGMYRLLRYWKISPLGAGIGALSWTFGGNLFFQYCNLIFLIGAAWFPWGIRTGLAFIEKKSIGSFLGLALILALILLGGEPQSAYLIGLFLIFWVIFFAPAFRKIPKDPTDPSANNPSPVREGIRNLSLLACAALLAGLIAAIQLIPGHQMARNCDRFSDTAPVSLWELPSYLMKKDRSDPPFSGILSQNIHSASHSSNIYHFSFAPWRTIELLWPNIGGEFNGEPTRWLSFLPYDDQIWNPTIYMGILPLLLGISAFTLFRTGNSNNPVRRWVSWILLLSLLAAWGGFGIGWIIRFISSLFGSSQNLSIQNGDPVGGVYWFMDLLLPGFSLFRYPAKMMVPFGFALSILAGFGWDQSSENPRFQRFARFFLIISLIGTLLFFLLGDFIFASWKGSLGHSYLKFDVLGARKAVLQAFFQSAAILFLYHVFIKYKEKKKWSHQWFSLGILMIIALDLFRANVGFVYIVPYSFYHDKPLLVEEMEFSDPNPIIPPRVFRYVEWNPLAIIDNSMRIQKGAHWDRKTLAPKYSYPSRIGIVNAQGTMMNRDYAVYLHSLKEDFVRSYHDPSVAKRFRDLGISWFILPYRDLKNREVKIPDTIPVDRQMPRLYSFFDEPRDFFDNLEHDWPVNTLLWKFQKSGDRIRIGRKQHEGEFARITRFDPNRIEMEIHLNEPASIILTEQYWPEWKAEARSKSDKKSFSLPIYPENKIFRRLEMPAGDFSVVMEYAPCSFYKGMFVSIFTLLAIIFCLFFKKRSFSNGKILQIR